MFSVLVESSEHVQKILNSKIEKSKEFNLREEAFYSNATMRRPESA
jgi:hypothetical protein